MKALMKYKDLAARPEFDSRIMTEVVADMPQQAALVAELAMFSDKFLPLAIDPEGGNIQLITNSANGVMSAYNNGDIASTIMPGMDALRYNGNLNFVESIRFDKGDLDEMQNLLLLSKIPNLSGYIVKALAILKTRFEYRRALLIRDFFESNAISVDSNGVVVSETALFGDATASAYHLTLADTPSAPFTDVRDLPGDYAFDTDTTSYYWDEANASILDDLGSAIAYITDVLQREIATIWLPPKVLQVMNRDSEIAALLSTFGLDKLTAKSAIGARPLMGYPHEKSNHKIYLEKEITADFTLASDTTITVSDTNHIGNGSPCILVDKAGKHEYFGFITSATGTTITLEGDVEGSGTISAGSKVKISVPVIPQKHIVFELVEKTTQFTATPTVFAGGNDGSTGLGFFANSQVSQDEMKPGIDVWSGYEGRIDVYKAPFVVMRVLA